MIEKFLNEFTGTLELYLFTVLGLFLMLTISPYILEVMLFFLKGLLLWLGVLG